MQHLAYPGTGTPVAPRDKRGFLPLAYPGRCLGLYLEAPHSLSSLQVA